MIIELVGAGLVISACLAIFFDEAVYSVAALASMLVLTSILYALNGAAYVAVFQFAVAVGTLSILFLSGEMLSEKPISKTSPQKTVIVLVMGVALSAPMILFSISSPNTVDVEVPFGQALWDLRAVDVILQGLVILTVALGIGIVLFRRKRNNHKLEVVTQ
jgi:NADH:ubiquinone oxidoreductase subunit 6 (subunit J)